MCDAREMCKKSATGVKAIAVGRGGLRDEDSPASPARD